MDWLQIFFGIIIFSVAGGIGLSIALFIVLATGSILVSLEEHYWDWRRNHKKGN